MLLGPALYDYFLIGVELNGVTTLTVKIAEETVLPSAEREIGHGRGDSDVDADISGGRFVTEAARSRATRCEQRRLVAVGAAFEEGEGFVHTVGVDQTENRAEDFRVGEVAGRRNVVENRGVHEVSHLVARDPRVAPVEQDFRALLLAETDERFHTLFSLRRDDGAHLHAFFEAVAHFELCSSVSDGVAKSLLRFADSDSDGNGEATLAGASKSAITDDLRRHGHVRVGEHYDVILGSALALAALPFFTGARINVARDRSRAHEAYGADFGVVNECVNHGFAAINQIHYAFGQASFFEKLVHEAHGERHALRRLENKRVAGGDGVRQIPERDHARKIEWHDGGGDAEGLANHHLVDAAGDVFEVVALHHHRNAAGHFDILDGATHFGLGLGEGLAVFLRDDAGDVADVIFEKHLQLEQRLDAVFRRSAAPFGKGGRRGLDRRVHFRGVGERDLGQRFAGGGIDHVAPLGDVRVGPLAVDVIGKPNNGR